MGGPASMAFLEQLGATGDKALLERDTHLLSDLMAYELRTVGSLAISAGNNDFADEIVQHLFNKALSLGDSRYALEYAQAYRHLEAQLHSEAA